MGETLRLSEIVGGGYDEFWNTRCFYRMCKGSKGSKKSKTTALWYIFHMMKYPQANTLVIRKVYGTLRDSTYTDLLWAIDKLGVSSSWTASISPLKLTYNPTGQVIHFRGLDDSLKIASISVRYGYLCWVWFEEFSEITNEDEFTRVMMSIRGDIPPETGLWKQITGTFNPWSEHSWIKKRFFDVPDPNVFTCTTTYRCNEHLGPDDIFRYEDMYKTNPRMARIVCDGDWGIAEGLVYDNWVEQDFEISDILREYPDAKPMFGLDFGFKISYNAFVAAFIDIGKKLIWIYDEMYVREISNLEIAKRINNMGYGKEMIIADSASPKDIFELKEGQIEEIEDEDGNVTYTRWQLPAIRPAFKGPDSIRNGVRRLQSYRMIVKPSCVNFLMELNNYCFDQDKDGNFIDQPIKDFDHLMDALRMASERYFVNASAHIGEVKGGVSDRAHKSRRVFSSRI